MGWLRNLYDYINEESEEGKKNRLEREKASAEQKEYLNNMKCPICGYSQFNKSLVSTNSVGDHGHSVRELISYYKSDDETFYNKIYEINSTMCLHCGYIVNFADMSTVKIQKLKSII